MTRKPIEILFDENRGLIKKAIIKNRRLLAALRLENEDVEQELAIAMLSAIEKFDPDRSDSLQRHISYSLQYEILNLKRKYKPCGLTQVPKGNRIEILRVDANNRYGYHYELPVYDDLSSIEISELYSNLTDTESNVVCMVDQGMNIRKKEEKEALVNVYEKYTALYGEPERMVA